MDERTTLVLIVAVVVVALALLAIAVRLLLRLVRTRRALRQAGLPAGPKWVFWGAVAYLALPADLVPDRGVPGRHRRPAARPAQRGRRAAEGRAAAEGRGLARSRRHALPRCHRRAPGGLTAPPPRPSRAMPPAEIRGGHRRRGGRVSG
ncbi:hypothetical protein M2169_000161 [Streptomyces sp. MJP52]|nr:hypothetical protein [Streptomyces sp. MJP52]